ncbi:hypothetical protein [Sodalis sp.]|uniref:hypothetical protein n=1 Tax=Sodalis sp. (in: enterobacteria) TaxID=1898979 RepID=UPI003873AAD0
MGHKIIDTKGDFMVVGAYPPDIRADFYRDDVVIWTQRDQSSPVPLPATNSVKRR